MSHTPGPWHTYKTGDGTEAAIADANGNGLAWCAIPDREQSSANARLIATAPELLYALKVFIDGPEARFMPGYLSAKAAIAKAEGHHE